MNQYDYSIPYPPSEPELSEPCADPAEVRQHFSRIGLAYLAMTVAFLAVAYGIQYAILFLCPGQEIGLYSGVNYRIELCELLLRVKDYACQV